MHRLLLDLLSKCQFPSYIIYMYMYAVACAILTQCACDGKTLHLIEGDTADLDFTYPCESSDITLQISNRKPFYSLQHQALYSMPQRYNANVQNGSDSGDCSIHLGIDPVTREDQGLFILTVYINGELLDEYTQRIVLIITYPPGPTSCELREGIGTGDWVALQCTASAGKLPGQIECYQGGAKLPPRSSMVETDEILQQTFWTMNHSYPTFCCTSALEQPKDKCECKDFVWDLSNKMQSNISKDPCYTGLAQSNSTNYNITENPLHIHVSAVDQTQITTTQVTQTKHLKKNIDYKSVLLILMAVIILLAVLIVIVRKRKASAFYTKGCAETEMYPLGNKHHSEADYKKEETVEDDEKETLQV